MRARHLPVLLFSIASACAVPVPVGAPATSTTSRGTPLPASTASMTEEVVRLTNEFRGKNGLQELVASPKLMQAARLHAEQMAAVEELTHTISRARYPTLRDRLDAVGYLYAVAGENIAWNQPDADDVMNTWLNSTGHRANIVDSMVTEIGAGMAYSRKGAPYWVQVFARPR